MKKVFLLFIVFLMPHVCAMEQRDETGNTEVKMSISPVTSINAPPTEHTSRLKTCRAQISPYCQVVREHPGKTLALVAFMSFGTYVLSQCPPYHECTWNDVF